MDDAGVRLFLYDPGGTPRARLEVKTYGAPALTLHDKEWVRAVLGSGPDGTPVPGRDRCNQAGL